MPFLPCTQGQGFHLLCSCLVPSWYSHGLEKQKIHLFTPYVRLNHANSLKVRNMNHTHENFDSGCIEQFQFVSLDLGPGFILCSSFACCSFKSILFSNVFKRGIGAGCWISFSSFWLLVSCLCKPVLSLQNLCKLKSEAM